MRLLFTLLLNTVPLAALNNTALAETLVQPEAQTEQPQVPQQAEPVELVNERTENAKIYQNEDGTRSAKVYSNPIHYKDDKGHFQDIDNNIVGNNDSLETASFKYQNKANRFKAFFAQKASAPNLVKIKKDDYALSFSPVNGSSSEGVISDNKITYPSVYDQIDLKYSVVSSGVKEEIIINSYTGQNVFSFAMDTKGLVPQLESNNTISLLDNKSGETVFLIAAPFAEDANGVFSGDVYYQIRPNGPGKYILDVVVSKEYLEDPERSFPVIVDPTTDTLSGTTRDAFIMSAYPSTNYYTTAEERVGWTSSTGIVRSYMKFTLPSLGGGIVSSASLKLYEFSGYTSSANVELHEIISTWDHTTITWNQRPVYNDVNLGTNLVNGAGQYSWDVSNLVTAWYDGRTNNGLMIKEDSENDYYRKFYASEAASNKPYILINYSLPSTPAATAVSSGVNTGTGYLNLSWGAVSGATSYGVAFYNGYQYQTFDVGNVTSWSTNTKAFYPTATDLTNGVWQFYAPGSGKSELRDDPTDLYTNAYNAHLSQVGTFSDYRNNQNYAIRTVAYRSVSIRTLNGTTDYTTPYKQESAFSAATSPTLPDSTRPPQVASVSIGGTNGAYGSGDSATVTATWTGVNDYVTGSNSGTDHYKVELVKTDLQTSTVTTTSVNVGHTGTGTHTYTFTNQPDYTRNQVKVTTYDKNSNYSNTVNSATWDSADRTSPTANITAPLDSTYAKGSVTVSGTATDNITFGNYKVEYGAGTSPSSWTQITSSTTAVSNGTLATWNTTGLNGVYTVRLTSTDAAGNSSTAQKTITVDNTSPTGTISNPANNGYVNGTFNIVGTAGDTNFKDYKVEYGVGSSPATWTLLNSSTTPVTSSTLASWNTTALTDGLYTVRLTVTDQINNVTTTTIQVTKDATAPVAAITDPIGGKNIKGSFNVIGSATDTNFNNYLLEYASQATPTAYNSIASSTTQVNNANLGTWNTSGLGDGAYNLRLTVTDKISQTTTASVTGVVVDNTLPTGGMSSPANLSYLTGQVDVLGSVNDAHFTSYKVEYSLGGLYNWELIKFSTQPVTDGSLTEWDTTFLSNGFYNLRLTVNDAAGNSWTEMKTVILDNPVALGTEDFYPTVTNQVGFGTSQTNITNGNLILGFEDLHIPGRGLDLDLARTYNSLDDSSTILGNGWRLNYEMALTENADGSLTLIDADGSVKNFAKYEGAYLNPPGVFYDIAENIEDSSYIFTDRAGTSYKFDSTGQLVRISDRNGNFLTLTYDASARLQAVTDLFNRQLTFEYLTDKVVVTDPALRKIEYTLTNGNLSNVKANYKDLSGNYVTEFASSYAYHPDGKIKEVIDPRGKKVTYGYTESKLSSYTKDLTVYSPDGNGGSSATLTSPTTTFAYNSLSRLTTVTDTAGNEQEYRYNPDGTLESKTLYPTPTEPIAISYTYNDNKQILTQTDAEGNVTSYAYNTLGLLTSELRPQARDFDEELLSSWETRYTYGDVNNPYQPTKIEEKELLLDGISYKEESTRTTDYAYDAAGNLRTEIIDLNGINFLTDYQYLNGQLDNKQVHKDSTELITTTYLYDSNNLYLLGTEVVSSLEPANKLEKISYEYNFETGNKLAVVDNFRTKTDYTYSGFGRLLEEKTSYTVGANPYTSTTTYQYDAVGNQTKVIKPGNRVTNYVYDEDNRLISVENPSVTVCDYGADDGSAPSVDVRTIKTYSFFDQVGNEVATMDGRGKVTNKEYDGIGRLIEIKDPLQNKLAYAYDPNNNQTSSTKYTFDGVGGYTNQGTTTQSRRESPYFVRSR